MCNYTNKNEAQLNEDKESHKNKELLKCDMCNFAEEDPRLMQKHKESHRERLELKCLMCGSILPSWQQAGSPIVDRPSTSCLGIVSVVTNVIWILQDLTLVFVQTEKTS